eukprot:CAMPEP_0172307586 /NCGR_PEP_ID=MMETSP1058-20130122/8411_1 /TAXON_ID=83371 /ORGANISM="Detonula confervacea, Strain CCMP 353" /LENGTH=955 /DNA_ID=CAMNT_0013019791 /DNA_START=277 /DNA_END=3144 /DNA_ORIENTATION=+
MDKPRLQHTAMPQCLARSASATRLSSASSSLPHSSMESSAFIFLLRRRIKKGPEPELIVDKINSDSAHTLTNNGTPKVNGNNNAHHVHYNLGDKNNGHHEQQHQRQNQLLDFDIVEDEPYANMHPIQNAYETLSKVSVEKETPELEPTNQGEILESSLNSMEGSDDNVSYIRVSEDDLAKKGETMTKNDKEMSINGDDGEKSSMWDKRNARSIGEGVRFKSQLREGLEEQTKLHRERLLSNLLEGAIGATARTFEFEKEKIRNATKPFRWRGFGRGNKDSDSEGEESKESPSDSAFAEIATNTISSNTKDAEAKHKPNSRKFGARTIAGLIVAFAQEVEGLEVEVDADANTPIWDKTVHSIKICFSRLGFQQIRMGGLDEVFSELEKSMSPSEKFKLASSFFNVGKPATADEAFDKIDVDNSGSLDEVELAQALKMAAITGGNRFGSRSKETLTELASRLVRLYDTDGDGVVDREEYQVMVQDMATLRDAKLREELHEQTELDRTESNGGEKKKKKMWFSSVFGGKKNAPLSNNSTMGNGENIIDVTENEEFWGAIDQGEGSIVLEDLELDLRRLLFGAIPGAKKILPGGPLILKPFTATLTASFNKDDIMDSFFLDTGLRRLVARALSRRVRGIRDLLDGAVFYGRTWKVFEQNSPQVEVAKLEDVHFDNRNRLIITGRAKIQDALGYKHDPIEQGFKLRTKIGTRANGRIIGLLKPEIAIFAECPKELERTVKTKCKEWFGYTMPTLKPFYAYIPLVSPLKKDENMDGFNMGEDNQIKSIEIKNGKLRIEISAFLRPGRFLGNHFLAYTVPNRTIILTVDRVREGMRIARRNKRLAELAAREVQKLAAAQQSKGGASADIDSGKPSISPEGKDRIRRLEKEVKATIQEEAILREMKESSNKEKGKSFISRFVEGYSGAIREELDLEMNARLSFSISDFFGSQDSEENDDKELR